jgi:SAM-dependent methyltransferase
VNESSTKESGAGTASPYALGRDPLETERLRRQSDELSEQSAWLLDRVGVPPGGSAVDLGCGPAGVLALLAERVGASGRAVGVDNDSTHVVLARAFVHERGLDNVEVVQAEAGRTGLPGSSFDVVHTRALLVNIPEPATVIAEMVRLAKPERYVLVQEPDPTARICYPPHPAWDRLAELYRSAFGRDGADIFIGRRLPTLLRQAGLVDVGVHVRADVYPPGSSRRTLLPDLARTLHPTILAMELASATELDDLDRAVRAHLANSEVLVLPHLFFLTWGRKPAAA